jgi:hypothetical protein
MIELRDFVLLGLLAVSPQLALALYSRETRLLRPAQRRRVSLQLRRLLPRNPS